MVRRWFALAVLAVVPSGAQAGLYYSGETVAELPSRWAGFLLDHRTLRTAGQVRPGSGPPSPLREEYRTAAAKLEQAAKTRPLTAEECADLGALHVRLGEPGRAVEVLRPAARRFPSHFRIMANLGTAWQLVGDLEQAVATLQEAVRLAPADRIAFERAHLKLVQLRLREGRAADRPETVDDLFGVRYVGESGKSEPGKIAAAELQKLPAEAPAVVQQLALWLPADGRLLWQLGELANAFGDVRTAAAILDGCVTEFALSAADLRTRRQLFRTAADALAKQPGHDPHRDTLKTRSVRPLVKRLDESTLPAIRAGRTTPVGWAVLGATTFAPDARPTFPAYLRKLNGTPVTLTGYIQPTGDDPNPRGFLLLEYPVGCWFCETPGPTGLVSVEMKPGARFEAGRGLVKVTGILTVNSDDPEDFLFRITGAVVSEPE